MASDRRTAGESALLWALRRAEEDLAEWQAGLNSTLHAMEAMAADHRRELIHEEQKGYDRGMADIRAEYERDPMGKGIDLARDDAPIHAAVLDDFKDQLLIVLIKRLGGRVDIPVSEVDATGVHTLSFSVEDGTFKFVLGRKQ